MIGLLPILMTQGSETEVIYRIALPMVDGIASTTVLTLILVPVIYVQWFGRLWKRNQKRHKMTGR